MTPTTPLPSRAAALRTPRIVWAAILGSTVMYFGVLVLLSGQWQGEAPPVDPVLPLVLGGMSVVVAALVPVMRRAVMGTVALVAPPPGGMHAEVAEDALEDEISEALRRYQTGTIVGMALSEAVVLFGFVLAFLTQDPLAYVPGWLVGLVLMGIQVPRSGGLDALLPPAVRQAWP